MSGEVALWVVVWALLVLSAVEVVHTWRVAQGRSTRRSRLFKGRLTEEMIYSDRAWQEANRGMLPGTVVLFMLIALLVLLGAVLEVVWSTPFILVLVVGVSIWNRIVGDRAAEKAGQ